MYGTPTQHGGGGFGAPALGARVDDGVGNPAEQMQEAARMLTNLQTEGDGVDLATLLRESPREAYSFQQLGWPAEIASVRTLDLPSIVLERYATRQSVCFCGVLPEIRRAWATVDNALFLWRFDVPDDPPVEYAGEEQAIVAVSCANPKPGVFPPGSVDRVIVLATTTEMVLLGASFDDENDVGDFSGDLTLRALDYACTTDDVVVKDIASTSSGRIFFAGDDEALYELEYAAADTWRSRKCRKTCHHGAAPKLLPSILRLRAPDPLRQLAIDEHRGVLYTRSESGVVCAYDLGPGCADASVKRVAELRDVAAAARQHAQGAGGLFYGAGGSGGSGYGSYGRGGGYSGTGSGAGSGSAGTRGARLVHVDVVCPSESRYVTLVAVCADGRRVYLTSLPAGSDRQRAVGGRDAPAGTLRNPSGAPGGGGGAPGGGGGGGAAHRRLAPAPVRLAVVACRDPLPQGSARLGMTSAQALRATSASRPLEVEAAFYGDGIMLLSDAAERDEDARLFLSSRDSALPSHLQTPPGGAAPGGFQVPTLGGEGLAGAGGVGGGYYGGPLSSQSHVPRALRETVATQPVAGRAAGAVGCLREVPLPPRAARDLDPPFPPGTPSELANARPARIRSELVSQHVAPRRRFVVVTNAGVCLLEKARPVDQLCALLATDARERVAQFFACYGQTEAATMCLALALGCSDAAHDGGGGGSGGSDGAGGGAVGYAASVAEKARRALEDPRLTGEPRIEGDGDGDGAGAPPGSTGGGAQGGFDMGRAIVQPRVVYSGVHAAAFAYAARTLAATWDRPLATPLGRAGAEDASLPAGNGGTFLGSDAAARSTPPPIGEALTKGGVASAASAAAGWLGNALRGSGLVDDAPGPRLACTTPTDVLLSLERRLAPLLEFLSSRRHRAPPEDPRSRGLGLSPQLRQRRRLNGGPDAGLSAAQAEERSFAALRGTLRRTTQACALLRACCGDFGAGPGSPGPADSRAAVAAFARTCAGLAPAHRAALSRMTLRRFASTPEGAAVAAALVDSLMRNASLEGSESAEALADALSQTAPLFFGGDERAWYKGRELLQLARDERDRRNLEASDRACAEALEILLTVPLAGDPTAACAELADLRCFHGVVALCLSAAAEAANRRAEFGSGAGACAEGEMRSPRVPEGAANHGDPRGDRGFRRGGSPTSPLENGGAERRFGENVDLEHRSESRDGAGTTTVPRDPAACHEYACVAIRALALGAVDDRDRSPPGSLGAVCAALPAEARARGLAATLRRTAQASSAAAAAAARAEARSAAATAEAAYEAARVSAEASREAHGLGHGGIGIGGSHGGTGVAPPGLRSPPSAAMVRVAAATAKEVAGASAGGEGSFLRRVFRELVDLGRDDDLFSLPAAPLEAYLADLGAFETARQGGALTQSQARHLELLAKLYAEKRKPGLAAQVFYALAERVADGAAVALEERGALLDLALAHARGRGKGGGPPLTNGISASSGGAFYGGSDVEGSSSPAVDAEFVDALEGKVRVFGFQSRLRAAFQHAASADSASGSDPSAALASVAALERELLPLSDMYNDFARPAEMYDVCLEMLHFSRYDDPEGAVARELWERYLAKAAKHASTRRAALDSACAAAARLGRELFPSDAAFPTSHVALHLELMAAGQWGLPEGLTRGEGGEDLDATGEASVASAVLRACRDDAAGAFAAYDRLLAPPGAAGAGLRGEARAERERRLQTPALRLRLLASAAAIVRRWDPSAEERSAREERERERPDGDHRGDPRNAFDTFGGSRDASVRAALADACAAYAGEARRLLQVPASAQGAAEALAAEFDRLAKGFA